MQGSCMVATYNAVLSRGCTVVVWRRSYWLLVDKRADNSRISIGTDPLRDDIVFQQIAIVGTRQDNCFFN
jgi:hypothetical protein